MLTTLLLIIWIPVNLWGYKQLKCLHLVWRGETRQKPGTGPHPFLFLPLLSEQWSSRLDCGKNYLNTFCVHFKIFSRFKILGRPPALFYHSLNNSAETWAGNNSDYKVVSKLVYLVRGSNCCWFYASQMWKTCWFSHLFMQLVFLSFILMVRQNRRV